jgi:hypothetical protein
MPNDECQMTNDERMPKTEIRISGGGFTGITSEVLDIRHSGFFRHLAFVIRHFP